MTSKITEIKLKRTVTRKERIDGVLTSVKKEITTFAEVPYVSGWARFGHYVIDLIFLYILNFIVAILAVIVLGLNGGYSDGEFDNSSIERIDTYLLFFRWLILMPAYYLFFEHFIQSSPGKAILGRVVVNHYGEKPSFNALLKRSFARAVPFDALSCLSETGWHDNWSDTFVIRKKDLEGLKMLQRIQDVGTTPDASSNAI